MHLFSKKTWIWIIILFCLYLNLESITTVITGLFHKLLVHTEVQTLLQVWRWHYRTSSPLRTTSFTICCELMRELLKINKKNVRSLKRFHNIPLPQLFFNCNIPMHYLVSISHALSYSLFTALPCLHCSIPAVLLYGCPIRVGTGAPLRMC